MVSFSIPKACVRLFNLFQAMVVAIFLLLSSPSILAVSLDQDVYYLEVDGKYYPSKAELIEAAKQYVQNEKGVDVEFREGLSNQYLYLNGYVMADLDHSGYVASPEYDFQPPITEGNAKSNFEKLNTKCNTWQGDTCVCGYTSVSGTSISPYAYKGWRQSLGNYGAGREYTATISGTIHKKSYHITGTDKYCEPYTVDASMNSVKFDIYSCPEVLNTRPGEPANLEDSPECRGPTLRATIKTCYAPFMWDTTRNSCVTECKRPSVFDFDLGMCVREKEPQSCEESCKGDPILIENGESYQPQRADFIGGGAFPISFSRNYKSYRIPEIPFVAYYPPEELEEWDVYVQPSNYTGRPHQINELFPSILDGQKKGHYQWRHSYQKQLFDMNSETVAIVRADDHMIRFKVQSDSVTYLPVYNMDERLVKILDENQTLLKWELSTGNGIKETYDPEGKLILLTNTQGLTQTLAYNDANRLSSITDSAGRQVLFSYGNGPLLNELTQPDGKKIRYQYDDYNNLTQVIYPDETPEDLTNNPTVKYQYDQSHLYSLSGHTDENNDQYATWTFDDAGRATGSQNNNGFKATTIEYSKKQVKVVEANGAEEIITYDDNYRAIESAVKSCAECSSTSTRKYTYNALGQVTQETDRNGIITTFEYNSRGLKTKVTEAYGTNDARITTTEWHETLSLPLVITTQSLKTSFSYGENGRIESVTLSDLTGQSAQSRTTSYEYYPSGLLHKITAPNNGVTTYVYNAQKDLVSITNALAQTTEILQLDANGRPLLIKDPNGLETTLTYDARGQLTSQSIAGNVTYFVYDKIGQITQVTLPNGSQTQYEYSGARLLNKVSDSLGNQMLYTYDNMGNVTKIEVKDVNGELKRTQSQVFDLLNRLIQQVGANNQTTEFGYDAVGNRTRVKNPLLRETTFNFDALNRLKQSTDPKDGVTIYQYDSQDNLISVTDARENKTSYVYDGFGNLLSQTSPDTGTTAFTYDISGNMLSQTDANGITIEYRYDLLNRLTDIIYPETNAVINPLNVTLSYDQGENGKGHLTMMTDASGRTEYHYNALGQLTSKTSIVDGKGFQVSYVYDAAGLLNKITYPSARELVLTRAVNGQISKVESIFNGQTKTLLSGATYQPFGPASGFVLGNGKNVSRQFDLDGRLTSIDVPGVYQTLLSYNNNSNIVKQQMPLQPSMQQDFTYDELDRLTEATGVYGNAQYQYDKVSNRTQKTMNADAQTLDYDPLSNRLSTGYEHDNNGNRTTDSRFNYQYTDNNRLAQVTPADATNDLDATTYQYNGLGQRVKKSNLFGEVIYLYDESGLLIAEADKDGKVLKEYVYFEGQPLTMMVGE